MEAKGGTGGVSGQSSSKAGEKGGSWARVVEGPPRQSMWASHKITDVVGKLQSYFTKVLEFLEKEIEESQAVGEFCGDNSKAKEKGASGVGGKRV